MKYAIKTKEKIGIKYEHKNILNKNTCKWYLRQKSNSTIQKPIDKRKIPNKTETCLR